VHDPEGNVLAFPVKPYAFLVQLIAPKGGEVTVDLGDHGTFAFNPAALGLDAPASFLDGRVTVQRAVAATDLGICRSASGALVYNDFSAMCVMPDGETWTAFVAYTGRANPRLGFKEEPPSFEVLRQAPCNDQLFVVREIDGVASAPVAVTDGGLDLFMPAIASDRAGGAAVFWSQAEAQNWDLYVRTWRDGSWAPPARLTTDANPDIYCVAEAVGDRVWIAWQSLAEGVSRIMLGRLAEDGSRLDTTVALTDGTSNCWMPALAADSGGNLAVGYDTYAKGNYDVHCAIVSPSGEVLRRIPVATSLKFEDRASVAFDAQDRLWIAWEEAGEKWGKDCGNGKSVGERIDDGRIIRVQCIDGERRLAPVGDLESLFPLQQTILTVFGRPVRTRDSVFRESKRYVYYPRLVAGADGRMYLAYREHDYQPDKAMSYQTIWSDRLTVLTGDRWCEPMRVLLSDGNRHAAPALCALPRGGVAVASAGDGRSSVNRKQCAENQNVRVGRVVPVGAVQAPRLVAVETVESAAVDPDAVAEAAAVARMRAHRARAGGTTYRILRGDFHRHTSFSGDSGNGDGCIDDAFRYALDAAALDTMGNGDHDNGGFEYPWYVTQKFYDVYLLPDRFVPMFSYERSVAAKGPCGHRNIVMARRGTRVLPVFGRNAIDENGSIQDTRMLFRFLREEGAISIPHTIGTGAGANFVDYAPDVDPVVEIYQGCRNAYEYPDCPRGIKQGNDPGFYWNLLKAGKTYGVIASSDHRSTHMSYAMLYVDDMTREAVLEAFRKRHCYAATDNILLDVRIGDHIMGDVFEQTAAPVLHVQVGGTAQLETIDIIRNAEIIHTIRPDNASAEFTWEEPDPQPGQSSYYVRVIQKDGEIAWGTPLWIKRPE
jgi:hypothetical protein